MPTINKYEMRSILRWLDEAVLAIAKRDATDCPFERESDAAWKLRMARERLLGFAIAAVAIEAPDAANDNIDMDEAA